MKTYGLILAATILLLPLDPAAVPQQTAPPPSANSGPSLAVTMQFLQDRMNDIGKVSFVASLHDTKSGNHGTNTFIVEFMNAITAPNQCRIAYHRKVTQDGATMDDSESGFSLRDVQDVVVEPYEQYQNEATAADGSPNLVVSSTNPTLTALLVRRPHGVANFFLFTEPQLAGRFAKAMVHAVELCGGGNKDPF